MPSLMPTTDALEAWEAADARYNRAVYGKANGETIRALYAARRQAEATYYHAIAVTWALSR